jgi:hypothetical protein
LVFDLGLTLSGYITDADGQPINDVRITVLNSNEPGETGPYKGVYINKTNAKGFYRTTGLSNEPGQKVDLRINVNNYISQKKDGILLDGSQQNFILHRKPFIEGRVMDAVTRQPIKRYRISRDNADSSVIYNPLLYAPHHDLELHLDGRFSMSLNNNRDIKIVVSAPGYASMVHSIQGVHSEETVNGVEILMKPMATLDGTVTGPDGRPIANASVTLGIPRIMPDEKTGQLSIRHMTTTDSIGHFELLEYPDTTFNVSAFSPGLALGSVQVQPPFPPVHIRLQQGAHLEGLVRTNTSDVEVFVLLQFGDDTIMSQQSDANGRYAFENVPLGLLTVRTATRHGNSGEIQYRDMRINSTGFYTANFDFTSPFNSYVEGEFTINGKPENRSNLVADIQLNDGTRRHFVTTTEEDGTYRLGPLPATTFFFGPQYVRLDDDTMTNPEPDQVTTRPGATTRHDFDLVTN